MSEDRSDSFSVVQRAAVLVGLLLVGLGTMVFVAPIPQDPGYHLFADTREMLGIPNFANVMSNAGFLVVSVLGAWTLVRNRAVLFRRTGDIRPYLVFFVAVGLVSLGSGYYHWSPSNASLLWDRLPMSIGFMALSSAVVADRVHARAGNGWLLVLLIALGLASLLYWHWTESIGRGDLRFYALVQFYPMLAIPIICLAYHEHIYTPGRYLGWIIAWYALSKALEFFDVSIFALTGDLLSGHSLKHLAAAVATYMVLRMLIAAPVNRPGRTLGE